MPDTSHQCPAPKCEARVPHSRFCCPDHWRELSKPKQNAILNARPGSREHANAIIAAKNWLTIIATD